VKCSKCQSKAVIELRRHHCAFCKDDYLEFFDKQVDRAVRRQHMFSPEDRILVGVSGGKDSLTLWDYLLRRGYNATALHIHLGIGDYSDSSYQKTLAFARVREAPLITVDLARSYGMGVPQLSQTLRRVPCSGCGLSKRYVLNKEAYDRGFTVVAMGHNLDDEAATLLGNIFHWEVGSLARQSPSLPTKGEKLVKRVKPLYTVTEREVAASALLRGIDYVAEECPNAVGARSIAYKNALDSIEAQSPGTKHSFVAGFLERVRPLMEEAQDEFELQDCAICGQSTTGEVCAFCKMWQQAHRRAQEQQGAPTAGPPQQ
jgi:tRNA-5-methyluridine54 2-sulfurtransferase